MSSAAEIVDPTPTLEPVLLAIAGAAVEALAAEGAHDAPEPSRGRLVGPQDGGSPVRPEPAPRGRQPSFHYLEPDKRAAAFAALAARAAAVEAARLGWRVAAAADCCATLKRLRGPESRTAILAVAPSAAPFEQAADLAEALAAAAAERPGRRLVGLALALDGRDGAPSGAFARPDSPRRATARGLRRSASSSSLFEALGDAVSTPALGGPRLVLTAVLATPERGLS